MRNFRFKKGFMLVEVLIACATISVITFGIFSAAQKGIQLSSLALHQTQASFLLEEGAEAVKSIRDNSWTAISNLTIGTTYYFSFSGVSNTWSLTETPIKIDNFTRKVVFSVVNRDGTVDISQTGTPDIKTRKVDVNVSWLESGVETSKTLSFYIADIFN